jgi:putative tryptophan/tyrosine transport system substrate-binding protein
MDKKSLNRPSTSCSDNRKSAIQNRKLVGSVALVLTLAMCGAVATAQQPAKIPRIGYLENTTALSAIDLKTFRERLRELGYIEGQNILIESRYWEGKVERLPDLAAELVRLNCDVILTSGTEVAEAAKNATKTIPIVMAFGADAVRRGVVADLAHPGGNVTGLTSIGDELFGKRLELLKEVIPKLSRVGFLWSSDWFGVEHTIKETETAARLLRIEIQSLEVKGASDFGPVFQAATRKRAQALLVSAGGFLSFHRKSIIELAVKNRLPAIYNNARYVEAGGLMTYAYDRAYNFRRAAEYVDKILKGTKPADLPVERPKKFEFVINLKAAKQIGLTIPPNVLARADRVIR